MPVQVILAAAAVAASLPLLWWSVAGTRHDPRRAVAQNLAGAGATTDLREAVLTRGAGERAVRPLIGSLAERARRLTPVGWVRALERRITLAGRPPAWPLERVLAAKLLLLLGAGALGGLLWLSEPSGARLVFALAVSALGLFAPDLLLYSRGAERQKQILLELPDTLDQMTICVEAGLGFESAMSRAGQSGKGPLADELVRTLQEMQVGVGRADALRNLAGRTTVGDLRHFALAITQAEAYGVPVAQVLRTQANELRVKRRQRAEEHAMKIPVKIIFPLVLCILPALFVVIMGPAVIRVSRTLFGAGGALGG